MFFPLSLMFDLRIVIKGVELYLNTLHGICSTRSSIQIGILTVSVALVFTERYTFTYISNIQGRIFKLSIVCIIHYIGMAYHHSIQNT